MQNRGTAGDIFSIHSNPCSRSWLRHCVASLSVAGSILDGVIGIFHWLNPSDRTIALGWTEPLAEMSTGIISCA